MGCCWEINIHSFIQVAIFFQVFTLLVICSTVVNFPVTMTAHHFPFLHRRSQSNMFHLQKCRSSLLAQVLHSTSQHHLNWKENGFFDTFKKFANVFETDWLHLALVFFTLFKEICKLFSLFYTFKKCFETDWLHLALALFSHSPRSGGVTSIAAEALTIAFSW